MTGSGVDGASPTALRGFERSATSELIRELVRKFGMRGRRLRLHFLFLINLKKE